MVFVGKTDRTNNFVSKLPFQKHFRFRAVDYHLINVGFHSKLSILFQTSNKLCVEENRRAGLCPWNEDIGQGACPNYR